MAVPARYDWTVWVKSDDPYTFTFKDGDERVDLSTTPVTLSVEWEGGNSILSLTTGVDDEIYLENQSVDATKGQVTVKFTDAQRALFPIYSKAKYQMGRTFDGDYSLDMYGTITFSFWVDYPA